MAWRAGLDVCLIMVAPTERYGQMARYTRALVFPSIRTALTTLIDAESFPSFELFAALGDCLEKDHLGQLVEQMDHGLNNRIGQYAVPQISRKKARQWPFLALCLP